MNRLLYQMFIEPLAPDAVIVGNGEFPDHPFVCQALQEAPFVCCCDGAAQTLLQRGQMPDVVVGDGDSIDEELRIRLKDRLHLFEGQDDNDLTKATRYCVQQGKRALLYIGCSGKREDHTLANISLMAYYQQTFGIRTAMLTNYGCFTAWEGTHRFPAFRGQQVSIFNLTCQTFSGKGLKWNPIVARQWWEGTLNEALENSFELEGDGCYIVFQTYKSKSEEMGLCI